MTYSLENIGRKLLDLYIAGVQYCRNNSKMSTVDSTHASGIAYLDNEIKICKGGRFLTSSLRIMALRSMSDSNTFDDWIVAFVQRSEYVDVYYFPATCDPGKLFMSQISFSEKSTGVAVLMSPQYCIGYARLGSYGSSGDPEIGDLVLRQDAKAWFLRDNDRDGHIDYRISESVLPAFGNYRCHIHGASVNKTVSRVSAKYRDGRKKSHLYRRQDGSVASVEIDFYSWSAGCQVIPNWDNFRELVKMAIHDQDVNGNTTWDYMILDTSTGLYDDTLLEFLRSQFDVTRIAPKSVVDFGSQPNVEPLIDGDAVMKWITGSAYDAYQYVFGEPDPDDALRIDPRDVVVFNDMAASNGESSALIEQNFSDSHSADGGNPDLSPPSVTTAPVVSIQTLREIGF